MQASRLGCAHQKTGFPRIKCGAGSVKHGMTNKDSCRDMKNICVMMKDKKETYRGFLCLNSAKNQ
ncbi:MAG: hypothetical protein A3G39_01495 [Deltaproteobacteria bacterium RIFCSPLOWO2_12_FULL_43_16]|nr:MAG: hypothetical protein A2Z89_00080 [Deltaproteobacteria bacterium GWA2_43_19]OGQ09627.1 MAG: hypothetical protein A3D30_01545 [Deltaproteobacteria bacterium RIFCSPHIGHO2_02_FULL_43_33]OGQ36203.1 MAG: hypothetical protein A3A85_08635 [Deltaproteobacteria bacterium RIFCSPLOWO2_01_FULL_42_9]OGQ60959.1 MAG: hypothetical protein A3G39_01495 [Deltaproteobacteria bacterium RIFCSPLOWO2_12_FULL_43_16]HBR17372.1 hypothetical protein [Deltaproteobacteria bacterium]